MNEDVRSVMRNLSQTKSMLDASKNENKRYKKKLFFFEHQKNVIMSEIEFKIKNLEREKSIAKGIKDNTKALQLDAKLQIANEIQKIIIQKLKVNL